MAVFQVNRGYPVPPRFSSSISSASEHTLTQPFYGPFSGTARVSRCQQRSSSGLCCARGDIRGRRVPTIRLGATPSRVISDPPPSFPHFYAGCPSCRNPPNLSWLGTGTKYAGLHTHWLGFFCKWTLGVSGTVCLLYFHTWCGLSSNLRCRSETCCTQLAENTGRKKVAKNRHLGTIAQFYWAISLQLRHLATIGKKLVKQQYVLHMSPQYSELWPTSDWDRSGSLRHPCKFQRVSRLGNVTARHLVVGVSQTLQRWTESATYVRQGDHHVGPHSSLFLVLRSRLW